jgi:hypothetical protein
LRTCALTHLHDGTLTRIYGETIAPTHTHLRTTFTCLHACTLTGTHAVTRTPIRNYIPAHLQTCTRARLAQFRDTRWHTLAHLHTCTHTRLHTYTLRVHTYTDTHLHTTHLHPYILGHLHTLHACTLTWTPIDTLTHIHTFALAHLHLHAYTRARLHGHTVTRADTR